jgi:hypothetical protein
MILGRARFTGNDQIVFGEVDILQAYGIREEGNGSGGQHRVSFAEMSLNAVCFQLVRNGLLLIRSVKISASGYRSARASGTFSPPRIEKPVVDERDFHGHSGRFGAKGVWASIPTLLA